MFESQQPHVQPIWYTGLGAASPRPQSGPGTTGAGRSFLRILSAIPKWFAFCNRNSEFPPAGAPIRRSPSPSGPCCC